MAQINNQGYNDNNLYAFILPDWKVALYRAVKVATFFHMASVLLGLIVSLQSSTTLAILWSISNAMTAPYCYFACSVANARLYRHRAAVNNTTYKGEMY